MLTVTPEKKKQKEMEEKQKKKQMEDELLSLEGKATPNTVDDTGLTVSGAKEGVSEQDWL